MLLLQSLESHVNQHRKQAFHWQNLLVLLSSCIPGPCPTEWFYNFLGSQMGTDDQSHQWVPDSKLEGWDVRCDFDVFLGFWEHLAFQEHHPVQTADPRA